MLPKIDTLKIVKDTNVYSNFRPHLTFVGQATISRTNRRIKIEAVLKGPM